jgi:hypothetical protein
MGLRAVTLYFFFVFDYFGGLRARYFVYLNISVGGPSCPFVIFEQVGFVLV